MHKHDEFHSWLWAGVFFYAVAVVWHLGVGQWVPGLDVLTSVPAIIGFWCWGVAFWGSAAG